MPKIKSAKKRAALGAKHREANKARLSALRTAVKKVVASPGGDAGDARARLTAAVKELDQAAAAGLIHKNTAARKKSRLAKKINALG